MTDDLGDGYGYQERRGKGWKERERHTIWVARLPCGCIVCAHVDGDHEEWIARWVRDGLAVEPVVAKNVSLPQSCDKCRDRDNLADGLGEILETP